MEPVPSLPIVISPTLFLQALSVYTPYFATVPSTLLVPEILTVLSEARTLVISNFTSFFVILNADIFIAVAVLPSVLLLITTPSEPLDSILQCVPPVPVPSPTVLELIRLSETPIDLR